MDPANLLTKWYWIVELAKRKLGTVLFSLNLVIDFEWMREAHIRTRKDGATGIDGVTAQEYEANLETNLRDLLERIKSGRYKAPPVRRTYIPKADGSRRPLGITTFEDKVAQRAIAMVLEAVYEQEFRSCSYGFRPGRSAHQALRQLSGAITVGRQHWVLDVDVRKYLDRDSYYTLAYEVWLKRSCCERMRLRRGPFLRPCLTWMAWISPRLTRCHTACREMPSWRMA
jgi:retron-type reverse transcriptase